MSDIFCVKKPSSVLQKQNRTVSKKSLISLLTMLFFCVMVSILVSCQPVTDNPSNPSNDNASESSTNEGLTVPGDFMNPDSGEWDASMYTNAVNAGNRGCNACHEDLFSVLSGETIKGLHEVDKEAAYGRVYGWNECVTCHVHAPGDGAAMGGAGSYLAPTIHGAHYASKEFVNKNGNCFSCHEVDIVTGELGMWDELKYTKLIGLGNTAPVEVVGTWLSGRGFETGTVTGGVIERDIVLENISLSQDTTSVEDLYSATNMDYPDINEENYEFTMRGVVNEKTYTLDDLRALPQSEVTYTKMCFTNGSNGGWFISNIPAKGVLVSDLIEDCGGLLETSNAFSSLGHDGWVGPATPTLASNPLNYMDPNALIAVEYCDAPIDYMDGGPAVFVNPGAPAVEQSKWVKELIFYENENVNPDFGYSDFRAPAGISAGWFSPARDGQEFKVGETINLEGFAWAMSEQGKNRTTSVNLSADYGDTWTTIEVPTDFDEDQWVHWSADWTPEVAGTYCLTVRCGNELTENPTNDGSVLITVVE